MSSLNKITLSPSLQQDYEIDFAVALEEFSNDFAKAYKVKTNRTNKKSKRGLYALFLENYFPSNLDKIISWREIEHEHVQRLLDLGKYIDNHGSEKLCAIFEFPAGKKLSFILQENTGHFDENFIVKQIFPQLSTALVTLHNEGIFHGSINTDTVYYDSQNMKIQVAESISSYSGFYQKPSFETITRISCHPAGKSDDDYSADYYASGVLLCNLIAGGNPLALLPINIIQNMKYENGSYDAIMSLILTQKPKLTILNKNSNLIKGLLHDKDSERWQDEELKKWNKKEINQSSPSRVHRQSSTSFSFNDLEYYSSKYLANAIQDNWQKAKNDINLGEFARWISFVSKLPDIERKMYLITQNSQNEVIIPDEKLSRLLYMLDTGGPLRYKNLCFFPDAMGSLLSYFFHKNDKQNIDTIKNLIDIGLIEGWMSHQEDPEKYRPKTLGWSPIHVKQFIRRSELGFGVERVLYDTNKYLSCRSSIVKDSFNVTLEQILTNLEKKRADYSDADSPGKHLCAFLGSKCEIEESIKVKNIADFRYIANMDEVKYMAIFALAQKFSGIKSLPNTAKWLQGATEKIKEKIKSKSIKQKIQDKINKATEKGSLKEMFLAITNRNLIEKDYFGYREARKQYLLLNFEKLKLQSRRNIDQLAYRMGLRISVIFSYLICAISILSVMLLYSA